MRTIKFRGKSVGCDTKGQWVYGYYYCIGKSHRIARGHLSIVVDPKTVGQFTGLHDKDGKEIYEGDIIKRDPDGFWGVIVWRDKSACFLVDMMNGHKVFANAWSCVHVIGNVHDNPELLTKRDRPKK